MYLYVTYDVTHVGISRIHEFSMRVALTSCGQYCFALKLIGLEMAYDGGDGHLLRPSSLTLLRGRRYGLTGRNGVGKSTLLHHLSKLAPNDLSVSIYSCFFLFLLFFCCSLLLLFSFVVVLFPGVWRTSVSFSLFLFFLFLVFFFFRVLSSFLW